MLDAMNTLPMQLPVETDERTYVGRIAELVNYHLSTSKLRGPISHVVGLYSQAEFSIEWDKKYPVSAPFYPAFTPQVDSFPLSRR